MKIAIMAGVLCLFTSFVHAAQTNRCHDVANAQGRILSSSSNVVTFSVRAQMKGANMSGRFSFNDRAAGVQFSSRTLMKYEVVDAASRHLTFTAPDSNGVPVTAVVLVCDFGGRGTNDAFGVVISGSYEQVSHLTRGNVTVRRSRCPE